MWVLSIRIEPECAGRCVPALPADLTQFLLCGLISIHMCPFGLVGCPAAGLVFTPLNICLQLFLPRFICSRAQWCVWSEWAGWTQASLHQDSCSSRNQPDSSGSFHWLLHYSGDDEEEPWAQGLYVGKCWLTFVCIAEAWKLPVCQRVMQAEGGSVQRIQM